MGEVKELREQVKKFVDIASEKEPELFTIYLKQVNKFDWWDEISPAHQDAIDEGLKQLDYGEGISHKEVMKKYDKYQLKD